MSIEQQLRQWQDKAGELVQRGLDRHVRLAVTGLSRAGKTAFITSLVNQLEHAASDARLPQWDVVRQGRLLGARRVAQINHHIPTFAYEPALAALHGPEPRWPAATRGVAEIRLELRYRSRHLLRRQLGDHQTLFLDIVDYPGEWLLDLPLLSQSFDAWSEQVRRQLERPALRELAEPWLSQCWQASDPLDESRVVAVAAAYTEWLHQCKARLGLHLVQPGRFVLPGEYAGAPMLQFVPWVWAPPAGECAAGSLYSALRERFEHYKQHLVRGFYQQHFAGFDRQIVLVDCLQPLNEGPESFSDMQLALARIMESFRYGKSGWWQRLFAPRIDKLLLVASKADHVTPEQHPAMVSLLQSLVGQGRGQARFAGIETECMALASVRATEVGQGRHDGQTFPALRGTTLDGQPQLLFPGEVPSAPPSERWWQQGSFDFQAFRPLVMPAHEALPHIRLDAALQYLLGDKLE